MAQKSYEPIVKYVITRFIPKSIVKTNTRDEKIALLKETLKLVNGADTRTKMKEGIQKLIDEL